MSALVCALLSGVAFYLSQGVASVWPLAWVAPLPLLWLAYGKVPRWRIIVAGVAAFMAGQVYIVQSYLKELGPIVTALMLALALVLALTFVATLLFGRHVQRYRSPWLALLSFPAAWTSIEYLTGVISPHGSFGSLAYSQVSFPAAIQICSLFGLYVVTFLLCLFANALAMSLRSGRAVAAQSIFALGLCAASLVYGAWRLHQPQGEVIRVAALADTGPAYTASLDKDDLAATLAVTERYANAIAQQAGKGVSVVVTPEGSVMVAKPWRAAARFRARAQARRRHNLL